MSSNNPSDVEREHQDLQPLELEHQDLYKEPHSFDKKSRDFIPAYDAAMDRNKLEFAQKKVRQLKKITEEYNNKKVQHGQFFDSKLIFKIETRQNRAGERKFTEDLKDVEIEIVSSAASDKGVWIGYTKDEEFSKLKQELRDYNNQHNPVFLDIIKEIKPVEKKDKIMPNLKNNPMKDDEVAELDVQLEIIDSEKNEIDDSIRKFEEFVKNEDGATTDQFIMKNLCMIRTKGDKKLLEKIIQRGQVKSVGRSPKLKIKKTVKGEAPIKDIKIGSPPKNATSILVVDSGVVEHPLLKNSLGEVYSLATIKNPKIRESQPFDDVGHGTIISGISLYGNVESCRRQNMFQPEVKIHSAKVMYKNANNEAEFDPDELLEHQLERAVTRIVGKDPYCKVINLSLGDDSSTAYNMFDQLPLATLVDELSMNYKNLIFVISAGNITSQMKKPYPEYLLEENENTKLIDPATAAHAITVGAVRDYSDSDPNIHSRIYPSSLTRVGLGYKGMIKPELVEFGGDINHNITSLEREFLGKGWFTGDFGTSTSAALISNYLGRLINKFPEVSRNLIKAFLISSTEIPNEKPDPIKPLPKGSNYEVWKENLRIYGYGKPSLEQAMFSEDNRVLLKYESQIEIGKVHYYSLYLPPEFFKNQGTKEISVTLVYDPPVKRNKMQYFGTTLDFRLFKNRSVEDLENDYSIPEGKQKSFYESPDYSNEILLEPGIQDRSKSIHQKAIIQYTRKPDIVADVPLVLAVRCTNRWIENTEYLQSYAIVVRIKHSSYNQLYSQVKEMNRVRHLAKVRVGAKVRR